ncbi:MAG: aminopeptidase [Gammaproteobacteria bacterium]|nr:aminopeptidase [Gammaproteobacteria bacterium]
MPSSYRFCRFTAFLLVFLLSGCGNLSYYAQSVGGQWQVWRAQQDIDAILADPDSTPVLKEKLRTILEIRRFASEQLSLPDNDSYRSYADLKRPYVVWNVFAAPELSVTPEQWCFLFAGCVSYRGYFSKQDAEDFASELKTNNRDVYVAGIAAYSTLGWFDDPVLNTVMHRSSTDLAALIFHELSHQKLYIKGDTTFNESFATAVEMLGTRYWLEVNNDPQEYGAYLKRKQRHDDFIQLVTQSREKLQQLYASSETDEAKRDGKQKTLQKLKQDYARLKQHWDGDNRYDAWFTTDLNNAKLASVAAYHTWVPAFLAIFEQSGKDWLIFYQQVEKLGKLDKTQRTAELKKLTPPTQ